MSRLGILLQALCDEEGVADVAEVLKGNLTLGGVELTVHDKNRKDPDGIYVYSEFGAVPPGDDAVPILTRLLELNLVLFGDDAPSFGINPMTRCVVMTSRLDSNGLTASQFADALRIAADKALAWREGHFLGVAPDASQASSTASGQRAA